MPKPVIEYDRTRPNGVTTLMSVSNSPEGLGDIETEVVVTLAKKMAMYGVLAGGLAFLLGARKKALYYSAVAGAGLGLALKV